MSPKKKSQLFLTVPFGQEHSQAEVTSLPYSDILPRLLMD